MTKKPEFEQFLHTLLKTGKPLVQQAREPYRAAAVDLLENTGDILVQRARKDGHKDVQIEIHGTWVGPSYDPFAVVKQLRALWPGSLFSSGEELHFVEYKEEVVTLRFGWKDGDAYLTGLIKITPA